MATNSQDEASSSEGKPKYATYMGEIYRDGARNQFPYVTTDPNKLQAQARQHLGDRSYNYVSGGAGEKATMDANRLAFRQWKIIPRMLRPSTWPDLSTTIFGKKHPSPVFVAPVGVQSIFHSDKETGVASVASELGIPYILSTAASSSMEEVATANGDGIRWFQLYWPHGSDDLTISLLSRAKAAGFTALVVTLDTWSLGWRPADLDLAYIPFAAGIGNAIGFSDPWFRNKFKEVSGGKVIEDDIPGASLLWQKIVFMGQNHSWERIAFLKEHWDGPILLKGIQHVEDAKLAVKAGVQGIVVSNHGGRQLDGAIASLEVLPEIVDAVGEELTVLFDSGIRTGADVVKALSLGAKGVLVGRPFVYGLSIGGKQGARDVLKSILGDVEQTMVLAGICSIDECKRNIVRKVVYGGDVISSS